MSEHTYVYLHANIKILSVFCFFSPDSETVQDIMSHGKRKLKSNMNSMSLFQKNKHTHTHTTPSRVTRGREGGVGAGRFWRLKGAEAGVGAGRVGRVGREGLGWSRRALTALPTHLAKS